jgi:hypothetical protein
MLLYKYPLLVSVHFPREANTSDERVMRRTEQGSLPTVGVTEISIARHRWAQSFPKDAPSTLAEPSNYFQAQVRRLSSEPLWYFSRPPEAAALTPVTLLHPVFGTFLDECMTHVPTRSDNQLVLRLSHEMSQYYTNEERRMSAFRAILESYGLVLEAATIPNTSYRTDGHLRLRGRFVLLVEGKNEFGAKGAEPIFQALSYYSSMVINSANNSNDRYPMFIIYLVGESLSSRRIVNGLSVHA